MQSIRTKLLREIHRNGTIPASSAAADKLMGLIRQNATVFDIAKVVKLSPALTANVLKLSNSASFGGGGIRSVEEAVFRLGTEELNKLAMAIGVMDRVAHLKVKVDWKMFWLHCLVTARVTEVLANSYRTLSGKEYLAGLLHDIGKLFIEHNFPGEFESALLRAMERKISLYEAEVQLYDTNHADVGGALCEYWHLNHEIARSVKYHHEPTSPLNKDPMDVEHEKLLALCILVADSLANMFKTNIPGAKTFASKDLDNIREWKLLEKFPRIKNLELDFAQELQKAEDTIAAFEHK
jgi:putative nucleotidyltransferase with HDIG domain